MSESEKKPESAPVIGLGKDKIQGVFSTQTVTRVGTGTTQRKTIQKTYWSVEEKGGGMIEVQALNRNYIPSGPKRPLEKVDFLAHYNPEPEFYQTAVLPRIRELNNTIVRGERHRERGAHYSAEFEFKVATNVDEENVRANFGLGLTYLDRGEQVRANDIFKRLVGLDATFEHEHKHLFNDFGINLRKNRMLEQALEYYLKAEELEDNDENLYHNIARVYYEQGNLDKCVEYLKKCRELNPGMEESQQFWDFLLREGYIDTEGNKQKDALPPEVRPAKKSGDKSSGEIINLDKDL